MDLYTVDVIFDMIVLIPPDGIHPLLLLDGIAIYNDVGDRFYSIEHLAFKRCHSHNIITATSDSSTITTVIRTAPVRNLGVHVNA